MIEAFSALAALSAFVRIALLGAGVGIAVVAAADWAVRTRRITPFSAIARFTKSRLDPRLAGIERQVVRAGGHASSTPWWALVAYIVVASLVIAALDMLVGLLRDAAMASSLGAQGVVPLVVRWAFSFLRFALLVRVLSSWFPRFAASPWVRWTHPVTEWLLRPLRRIIPNIGMIDITPIVAYFVLVLAENLVLAVLFPGSR
jgi:YggT family protein